MNEPAGDHPTGPKDLTLIVPTIQHRPLKDDCDRIRRYCPGCDLGYEGSVPAWFVGQRRGLDTPCEIVTVLFDIAKFVAALEWMTKLKYQLRFRSPHLAIALWKRSTYRNESSLGLFAFSDFTKRLNIFPGIRVASRIITYVYDDDCREWNEFRRLKFKVTFVSDPSTVNLEPIPRDSDGGVWS